MNEHEHNLIQSILSHYGNDVTHLVQILHQAQESLGWLSPETITAIANGVGWPRAKVEGTAAFYSFFQLKPRGRYCVMWSDNITDRMLGSSDLMLRLCEKLWIEPGHLSEDGLISVNTTSCLGLSDQGPALLVNYRPITRMTAERVDQMAELIRNQIPMNQWSAEWFVVSDNIQRKDVLLDSNLEPGAALAAAMARSPHALIEEIKASGLRGRGGAGFSTGFKWEYCHKAPSDEHYVVCNADEGEPGTFKDRVLLTHYADLVFEGMTIAGYAVGATKGMLYLRGEYRFIKEALESVLAKRRSKHLLGKAILGRAFDFDIEIYSGAGAYICGEESALIESLEGKPGWPRIRPPYPVTCGYLNKPTVVNNVETLAAACLVAYHGSAWYARFGTGKSTGTKLLSVSGDVIRPGIYEYPFGITVREVLKDAGVRNCVQAVQISGPSGVTISANEIDRRICFEDLSTAGSVMVFDCTRDMFEVAHNFVHFFAHESCGFCTPCRVGTQVVARLMDKLAMNHGSQYDIQELFNLHQLMQSTSHCGLGMSACNPIVDTLTKFRSAYEKRLKSQNFEPYFDLDAALAEARQMTRRNDVGAHLFNME